jgi:hypothetical protein
MRENAKIRPASEDSNKAVANLPAGSPSKKIPAEIEDTGSIKVNNSRLPKVVFDIEKMASARSGITANKPMITENTGKMNAGSMIDRIDPTKRKINHMLIVNSERARHRLR